MSKKDLDKKHITKHFIPFYPQQILFLLLTFGIKFYSLPYFMTIFQRATVLYNATIFQLSAAGSTIGGYFGANVGWFHLVPFSSIAFVFGIHFFSFLFVLFFFNRREGGGGPPAFPIIRCSSTHFSLSTDLKVFWQLLIDFHRQFIKVYNIYYLGIQ